MKKTPLPVIERIRKLTSEVHVLSEKLREKNALLSVFRAKCTHDYVVKLWSSYDGSLSYDYDDSHGSCRLCLACGLVEHGKLIRSHTRPYRDEYVVLTSAPFVRFESYHKKDPIINSDCTRFSLDFLIDCANKNGYKIIGY